MIEQILENKKADINAIRLFCWILKKMLMVFYK